MNSFDLQSETNQQTLVSSFLEIVVGQTTDTARHFLQASNWKLEDAIHLFYTGNEGGDVRAPLPVKRDVLYGESSSGYYRDEASTTLPFNEFDSFASFYCPPLALMYRGPFEKAIDAAKAQNKWLIANVQSTREFTSHMLNRDTWANETVAQTIALNFIFWQACDDADEGKKIITFYKLDSVPATLVIDPITGQKMRLWRGMIQPEYFLEDLVPFMDGSPEDYTVSLSRRAKIFEESSSTKEKQTYPLLPEEPKDDGNSLCRVAVRLPDGRRLQRNFLRSDPIQLLWSFCYENLEGADERQIRLTHAIPGAFKDLDYDSTLTFIDSGLANSTISVTWSNV